jgi:predicted alpha-1,6-mannanase (GH76 family)
MIRSGPTMAAVRALTALTGSLALGVVMSSGVAAAQPPTGSGTGMAAAPTTTSDGVPTEDRLADGNTIFGRSIELHISDRDALGWATINNGDPTDEVWLDRSYDSGETIADERLGYATIPDGARGTSTEAFAIDSPDGAKGVLRACGKAGNRDDIVCTAWVGVEKPSTRGTPSKRAIAALVKLYNPDTGLWKTTGWWNSANALTAVLDYQLATGDRSYDWIIANTYDKNIDAQGGNFTNDFIDDTGWWALAWIRAYDLTGEQRYLETAKFDADYMWASRDDVCGGGVVWNINQRYKNAVTNELFIKVAASLHNRIPGDTEYLAQALENWEWFKASGMINDENLINDGLDGGTCQNSGDVTWTYNQGIILGALTELSWATGDRSYLTQAKVLADASTRSDYLNPAGVLTEPCEANGCGADGPTFKGVYVRNLGELNAELRGRPYQKYLERQAKVSYQHGRNRFDQYGVHWAGPVEALSAATQQSGTEAQIAPLWERGTGAPRL